MDPRGIAKKIQLLSVHMQKAKPGLAICVTFGMRSVFDIAMVAIYQFAICVR